MSADLALLEANRIACLKPRETDHFVEEVISLINEAKRYQRGDGQTAARCKKMFGELTNRTVGRLIFKKSPKHESPKIKMIGQSKIGKHLSEKKIEKKLFEKINDSLIKEESSSLRSPIPSPVAESAFFNRLSPNELIDVGNYALEFCLPVLDPLWATKCDSWQLINPIGDLFSVDC